MLSGILFWNWAGYHFAILPEYVWAGYHFSQILFWIRISPPVLAVSIPSQAWTRISHKTLVQQNRCRHLPNCQHDGGRRRYHVAGNNPWSLSLTTVVGHPWIGRGKNKLNSNREIERHREIAGETICRRCGGFNSRKTSIHRKATPNTTIRCHHPTPTTTWCFGLFLPEIVHHHHITSSVALGKEFAGERTESPEESLEMPPPYHSYRWASSFRKTPWKP